MVKIFSDKHRMNISLAKKGKIPYVMTEEIRKNISNSLRGKNKGKHTSVKTEFKKGHVHSEEVRKKIKEARSRQVFSEESRKKKAESLKKYYSTHKIRRPSPSLETRRKMSETARRSVRYNFKGNTPLNKLIRESFKYRQWRSDVFTRDEFSCVLCGKRGRIEADHIKMFAEIIEEYRIKTIEEAISCEELWNINNGRTLCVDCHKKTENYGKLGNIRLYKLKNQSTQ